MSKSVKIVFGGGGNEDKISELSKNFIKTQIPSDYTVEEVRLTRSNSQTVIASLSPNDFIIPCLHGYPGESGEFIAALELLNISYFGCNAEASMNCFNKSTTKDLLERAGIRTTPYITLYRDDSLNEEMALRFFNENEGAFIKPSKEGSSIGCHLVNSSSQISNALKDAFTYSDQVLLEKTIKGRELEVAAFEYEGKLHLSAPGEVVTGDSFYTYDEKYSEQSKSRTDIVAKDLSRKLINEIHEIAHKAFQTLGLRDLSRIDFFLEDEQVIVNEINTFPGMTKISLFPGMLENTGACSFQDFLNEKISS